MKVLVTGAAGFIGSHVAEFYARRGEAVVGLDNLSRAKLLKRNARNARFNWEFLAGLPGVERIEGDVRDADLVRRLARDADAIVHTAGQTAVTTSMTEPREDFETNVIGSFNVLEAARAAGRGAAIVYCSTNKVYGDGVHRVPIREEAKRYAFDGACPHGIPEDFGIDHCQHTPYGCSKLAADLYMQDWARLYGLRVGVFRMSCIYGPRQFGFEDQGWLAWFTIAAECGFPMSIYGDGKQLRDILYVDDLVRAYDAFIAGPLPHAVYNTGGGPANTLSLLELVDLLSGRTGRALKPAVGPWRPSDQKVYVSDIRRARERLGWAPGVTPREGVRRLIDWTRAHAALFRA
jgi:CDP-paratose 2-epimerase